MLERHSIIGKSRLDSYLAYSFGQLSAESHNQRQQRQFRLAPTSPYAGGYLEILKMPFAQFADAPPPPIEALSMLMVEPRDERRRLIGGSCYCYCRLTTNTPQQFSKMVERTTIDRERKWKLKLADDNYYYLLGLPKQKKR